MWFLANLSGVEEKKQGCGVCQSESVDIDEVGMDLKPLTLCFMAQKTLLSLP